MEHELNLDTSNINSRQAMLKFLYNTFASEEPGNDNEVSRYNYIVETLQDNVNSTIYLRRPAPLNKGIDFTVNSNYYRFQAGRKRVRYPSHRNIFELLSIKKEENEDLYVDKVIPTISRIYTIDNITDEEYNIQGFSSDYPIELILKLLKWLFIEQDATYWNKSGRQMLYSALQDYDLV